MITSVLCTLNGIQRHFNSHVLLYHATFSQIPEEIGTDLHNVTAEEIYKQIGWLKKHFDIVFVDELFESDDIKGKAAITFDDGYLSVFQEALPVLKELNAPSTVFLNGITLEGKAFWRDKIRLLLEHGLIDEFLEENRHWIPQNFNLDQNNFFSATRNPRINSSTIDRALDSFFMTKRINSERCQFGIRNIGNLVKDPLVAYGNHSYNHYVMSSLSPEEQRLEISRNQEVLKSIDHNISRVFSIPFGTDRDLNDETLKIVKEMGFIGFLYLRNATNFQSEAKKQKSAIGMKYRDRYLVSSTFQLFQKNFAKLFLQRPEGGPK